MLLFVTFIAPVVTAPLLPRCRLLPVTRCDLLFPFTLFTLRFTVFRLHCRCICRSSWLLNLRWRPFILRLPVAVCCLRYTLFVYTRCFLYTPFHDFGLLHSRWLRYTRLFCWLRYPVTAFPVCYVTYLHRTARLPHPQFTFTFAFVTARLRFRLFAFTPFVAVWLRCCRFDSRLRCSCTAFAFGLFPRSFIFAILLHSLFDYCRTLPRGYTCVTTRFTLTRLFCVRWLPFDFAFAFAFCCVLRCCYGHRAFTHTILIPFTHRLRISLIRYCCSFITVTLPLRNLFVTFTFYAYVCLRYWLRLRLLRFNLRYGWFGVVVALRTRCWFVPVCCLITFAFYTITLILHLLRLIPRLRFVLRYAPRLRYYVCLRCCWFVVVTFVRYVDYVGCCSPFAPFTLRFVTLFVYVYVTFVYVAHRCVVARLRLLHVYVCLFPFGWFQFIVLPFWFPVCCDLLRCRSALPVLVHYVYCRLLHTRTYTRLMPTPLPFYTVCVSLPAFTFAGTFWLRLPFCVTYVYLRLQLFTTRLLIYVLLVVPAFTLRVTVVLRWITFWTVPVYAHPFTFSFDVALRFPFVYRCVYVSAVTYTTTFRAFTFVVAYVAVWLFTFSWFTLRLRLALPRYGTLLFTVCVRSLLRCRLITFCSVDFTLFVTRYVPFTFTFITRLPLFVTHVLFTFCVDYTAVVTILHFRIYVYCAVRYYGCRRYVCDC